MKKIWLALLLLVVPICNSQVLMDTGEITIEVANIISTMPGNSGDNFVLPTTAELSTWGFTISNLLSGNYSTAADSAALIDYSLTQFSDTSNGTTKTYYMLKEIGTNYWGTYVLNPDFCRAVVVQAPHPIKDFNTGKEAIYVFNESNCYFFMMSGTSRCNHATSSSCDGTTSVCSGSSEPFRISDLAHNESTVFQSTTDTLFHKYSNTHFIQLHGFTKLGSDPYIILSNGTQDTPTTDFITILDTKLYDEDNTLTSKIAHVDLAWTRLTGTTNSQGRLINSSSDNCTASASVSSGRFIHMEQELTKLRNDATGWLKVSNALIGTFSCSVLWAELIYFNLEKTSMNQVSIEWKVNHDSAKDNYRVEKSKTGKNWQLVNNFIYETNTGLMNSTFHVYDDSPFFGISYYRLINIDENGHEKIISIKSITDESEYSVLFYPNPTKDFVNLKFQKDILNFTAFTITDVLGKEVTEHVRISTVSDIDLLIDLSMLRSGVYVFSIENKKYFIIKN